MEEAIEASTATFVGTVFAVENYRRWATVDVEEIWHGTVDTDRVIVKGGPRDPVGGDHVATTIDRSYRVGKTYLFVVYTGNGSVFKDNICSSTAVFGPELERFRPASATINPAPAPTPTSAPTPSGIDLEPDDDTGLTLPLAIAAALAAGVIGWTVHRRRSSPV